MRTRPLLDIVIRKAAGDAVSHARKKVDGVY
jgi:hypothetical protein